MKKSDILAALERMPGDPEIEVRLKLNPKRKSSRDDPHGIIDRINEYPRPEIVVIEK